MSEKILVFNQGDSGGGKVATMFDGFFNYVTPALPDKIRLAVDRGVEVNFLISENQIETRFTRTPHYSVKPLLDAGANVYFYDSPDSSLLDYKLMLADDRIASIGSANYNFSSQTTSKELSVVVEDEETLIKIRDNLKGLLKYSRPVSCDEALSYQGFEYLAKLYSESNPLSTILIGGSL